MLAATNVDRVLDELYKKLVVNMVLKYQRQGSGKTLTRINYVDMIVYEYDPTRVDTHYAKEDLLPSFETEFDFKSLEFLVDVYYCDACLKQHAFREFEIANDTFVNIYTLKNRDKEQRRR